MARVTAPGEPRFGPVRAVLVRRSRAWAATTASLVVVAALFAASVRNRTIDQVVWLFAFFGTIALAPFVAWLGYGSARRDDVMLSVEDGRVVMRPFEDARRGDEGGARRFTRGSAAALPDGRFQVDLHPALGPRLRVEVEAEDDARGLLGALGLDRRAGTTRFAVRELGLRLHASRGVAVATVTAFYWLGVAQSGLSPIALFAGLLTSLLLYLSTRATLTVGADGIELHRRFGRSRFVRHDDVTIVTRLDPPRRQVVSRGVRVVLRSGERIDLDTCDERFRAGTWKTDPVYDALQRAGWTAGRRRAASALGTHLAKGTRSTEEWVASLRAIGAGDAQGQYRVAPVDLDALFEVALDPSADVELRAGAVLALGATKENAARLRVAADEVADPVVRRIALLASESDVAHPDDEEPKGNSELAATIERELRRARR